MKEELIKYVMERADMCFADDFPIDDIKIWIEEFFNSYQPERSKREDVYIVETEGGIHYFHSPNAPRNIRCGALNTVETQ